MMNTSSSSTSRIKRYYLMFLPLLLFPYLLLFLHASAPAAAPLLQLLILLLPLLLFPLLLLYNAAGLLREQCYLLLINTLYL